jgi:hypothetical protein
MPPNIPIPCAATGKAACPHRQLQEQAPSAPTVPVPAATDAAAAGGDAAGGAGGAAGAAGATLLVPAPAAPALEVPPVMALAVPVPFCAIAMDLNICCVLFVVGLMLKAIPLPQ